MDTIEPARAARGLGAPADPRPADLRLLNEIGRIATLDLELRPMLQRITDVLARQFQWEFVALVTIDYEHDRFRCEAVTSSVPTAIHVDYMRSLGSGIVGQVAATGESVVIDDVRSHPNYVETMPGALSEMCIPIRHRGRTVAIINLESRRLGAFQGQLPLLETVADQIAGAIANAQQYRELQEMSRLLELKTAALEEANAHLANAVETLHRISTQDGLTGISNRRHFDEVLGLEWRRAVRSGSSLAVLLLDIDHFKQFNDTSGHQAGDDCLRAVADTLRSTVQRATDLVARYGGEEFAILLPETDHAAATVLANTLRERVGHDGEVTVSIGVAGVVPTRDVEPATLVKLADEALYAAKAAGRNCVR